MIGLASRRRAKRVERIAGMTNSQIDRLMLAGMSYERASEDMGRCEWSPEQISAQMPASLVIDVIGGQ
jgi:hypothetical protein